MLRELDIGTPSDSEPLVWLVHVISPSTYDESRFHALIEGLLDRNVGVICCPSAAISMRQVRPFSAPTHNSIARVLEMLAAGVQVRIGSDNVCDITSPAGPSIFSTKSSCSAMPSAITIPIFSRNWRQAAVLTKTNEPASRRIWKKTPMKSPQWFATIKTQGKFRNNENRDR